MNPLSRLFFKLSDINDDEKEGNNSFYWCWNVMSFNSFDDRKEEEKNALNSMTDRHSSSKFCSFYIRTGIFLV